MAAFQKQANPKHEVVVVTGASAGVGRAIARRFARAGAWMGLVARDQERLDDTLREVEALGGKAVIFAGDVADPATHESIADLTEQRFGAIDIWVNNAAAAVHGPIWELEPKELQRVTDVTYLGVVYGTQSALRRMRLRNQGTIVQVGSASALRAVPFESAASAARHAVRGFTDAVRAELRDDGRPLRLTLVHLAPATTSRSLWNAHRSAPLAKPLDPAESCDAAAETVYWAAHHRRREVFVSGSRSIGLSVHRLLPGVLDRAWSFAARRSAAAPRVNAPAERRRKPALGRVVDRAGDPQAESRALQLSVSQRRAAWLWAIVGMASAVAFAWRHKSSRRAPVWARR